MKKSGILNSRLAAVIAELGHTDLLAVADAGLPIPPAVERVDLAVSPGLPGFLDVTRAVVREMKVQRIVIADEMVARNPHLREELLALFPGVEVETVPHEAFKARTREARAVVRTGECSPYANVILESGVTF